MTTDSDLAADFERYRDYLCLLARSRLSPDVGQRVAASDIVQQTLIEAHQAGDRYERRSAEEEVGWLRKILAHNLANAGRDHRRAKRDVAREQSLEADLARSSMNLANLLPGRQSTPSQQAMRQERVLLLAHAMAGLPEEQYQVLLLQHWHGWSLRKISEQLQITRFAATRLIRNAIATLQDELGGLA